MKKTYADSCIERAEKANEIDYKLRITSLKKTVSIGLVHKFLDHSRTDVPELARRLKKAIARIRKYASDRLDDEFCDELEAMPE